MSDIKKPTLTSRTLSEVVQGYAYHVMTELGESLKKGAKLSDEERAKLQATLIAREIIVAFTTGFETRGAVTVTGEGLSAVVTFRDDVAPPSAKYEARRK